MRDILSCEFLSLGAQQHTRILAVGSPEEWARESYQTRLYLNISFVAFHEITAALLETLRPEAVVSPALARNFDCIELACLLHNLDFRGAYRATAYDLPNPQVIENEISELCPRLDFRLITER